MERPQRKDYIEKFVHFTQGPIHVNLLTMSIFMIIFMYATWSSVFSLGKWTLGTCPPLFLTASRMLIAAALLLGFMAIAKRSAFRLTKRQLLSLAMLGLFSIYLTNAFEFWSLQHMTAAKTCFFYSLCPFFSALFSYIHFGEKMNKRKWLGMGIGFMGFIPVLASQKGAGELLSSFGYLSWPEISMLGAAICTSYGWILLRLLVKGESISPLMANGASMLIGGTLALIHSFLVDSWHPIPVAYENLPMFLQGTLLMTLISNVICYNLYGLVLKKYTATFVSFMGLLSPIFASMNSWLILGEKPSLIIFASTGIVSMGLWLIYSAELKQGYIQKAEKAPEAS
jgi:drug/metabolite transporter (DMT)-like permease